VDRVGVVGLSMGGEEALGAAARTPTIRAVVAEGVTGRSAGDLGWLVDAYGWRGAVTQDVHRGQTWVAGLLADAPAPPPLRSAVDDLAPGSVLLVAAGASADEQAAAASLHAAAPRVVDVWVVAGAGHTGGLRTDPDGWEDRVTGFLDRALGGAGDGG
jgi:pimeloyl-ACP methyl ester carboxylesterase